MEPDETGIIGGASPRDPERPGWASSWPRRGRGCSAALAVTILTAQPPAGRRRGISPRPPPAVALFGLHGLGRTPRRAHRAVEAAPGWFRVDRRAVLWGWPEGSFLLAFNGLYGWRSSRWGSCRPTSPAMLRGMLPGPALFIWAALLAPVVEELYFRGRLLDALSPKLGPRWAGDHHALAFAAIHGIPAFFPAYLVFAFVLLALRRRTGGLAAPILAHVINNASPCCRTGLRRNGAALAQRHEADGDHRLAAHAVGVGVITQSSCELVPSGITSRPPGASCSASAGGTRPAPR